MKNYSTESSMSACAPRHLEPVILRQRGASVRVDILDFIVSTPRLFIMN